ncbi:MAG TPA: DNRLRE domain-containing protein, partial [Methanosarcinales archaeon]|nr:DNRLRE domain-containing protein [Methanosarcinales archaeon]
MNSKERLVMLLTMIVILTAACAVAGAEADGCPVGLSPETQSAGDPLSCMIDDTPMLFLYPDWSLFYRQQTSMLDGKDPRTNLPLTGAEYSPSSTTVTLTAVADTTVKSWQPDSNFGSEEVLELSYSAIDVVREEVTLLRFDLASAIPANAIIDSAVLELFLVDGAGADPAPVAAYFVTSNWAESSVTWNSFPTAEPIGVVSQVYRSPGYKSWDISSFAWVWQGGSNNGVFLRGPVDGTYYERTFESREHDESVPRLVVTY